MKVSHLEIKGNNMISHDVTSGNVQKMIDPCTVCMVCGSIHFELRYAVTDTNQDVPGEWDILACRACGTGVLSPFPHSAEISGFYRNVFYTEDGRRFRNWMEGIRGALGRLRGVGLNRLKPGKGHLLDFGSGAGHFSVAQRNAGWVVDAVDPYSAASSDAGSCRVTEAGIELLYPDGHFDAISLWYVIEHLPNPSQVIKEMARVLKPDGILILAQQDFSSIQARVFGDKWLYLDPPRHLWQFTCESLVTLAQKHGLRVVKKSWASMEMGPFSILQSTLNLIVGNRNDLFRFLKNRKLSNPLGDKNSSRIRLWPTVVSLVLLPLLGPPAFLAYFALLCVRSGDVVTLYLRKA
jgi:SAM-dependent methyltransferase